MNSPHVRIAWLIAVVAIIAFNSVAFRTMMRSTDPTLSVLIVGAVPMLEVLALGGVARITAHGWRRFLDGFLMTGAMALAIYVALAMLVADELILPAIQYVLEPLFPSQPGGPFPSTAKVIMMCTVVSFVVVTPQIIIALIGGFLASALTCRQPSIEDRTSPSLSANLTDRTRESRLDRA